MRKSLKSKGSSKHRPKPSASPPPPPAASIPPSQPHALVDMQAQVDTLNSMMTTLSESLFARMDALQASLAPNVSQPSSRPSHRPDVGSPQPGVTAGESRMFQTLGETSRKFEKNVRLDQGVRPPRQEYASPSAASQPRAAPPRHEVPPQPSTSGWVPSGPQPPHSFGSWLCSKSEDSETESEFAARESSSSRLAELIYEVCPHSRPLLDDSRPPRCEFEGWFGQPEVSAFRPRFRLYPRVGEVESEVTAKASSLARRFKPLSSILTTHYTRHAVADLPYYESSLAVNPSFSQLAGAKAVGSKCWGSVSFSEMEMLERLFRAQLEMTSKSLWLMSGILAMLKHDGFQPADPTLFNAALASASATLSQTARSSAAGSTFVRAKRRDSLLALAEIPVPETQRRALTVSPGSESLLFDEEILGVVVSQVQQSSLISSNLAMSRSLERGRGRSTSSPLAAPSSAGTFRHGQQRCKRSSSASKFNSRKRSGGGVRGRLLLPDLRVSGSRSHHLA